VQSFVKHFRREFEHYVEHGHSLVEARERRRDGMSEDLVNIEVDGVPVKAPRAP